MDYRPAACSPVGLRARIGVTLLHAPPLHRLTRNYLGIDVHKRESHVTVLDEDGEVVGRGSRRANLDDIAEECTGSKAVIETTGNYYTVYDILDEHLDIVVADPGQTKAIGIAEVKNDRLDAKLRLGSNACVLG